MKIVVSNGIALAAHTDAQDVAGLYPGCIVLTVPDGTAVEVGEPWVVGLDEAVQARTLAAAAACKALLDPLSARFPEQETKTWAKQLAEAKAILSGDLEPTIEKYPAIGGLIAETGETWQDFAAAVEANDETWTKIVTSVAGQRQRFVAALKAAAATEGATVADVLAVPMAITLPGA